MLVFIALNADSNCLFSLGLICSVREAIAALESGTVRGSFVFVDGIKSVFTLRSI